MVLYQINVEANYGSTGKIAEALGNRVIDRGGKAYLAHGRKHRKSNLNTFQVGNWWSYGWHLLISRLFDAHGKGSFWATRKLVRHLEKMQPDIIHLHNIHGYFINYKVLFQYLEKYQGVVIWTLHDCWAFTGHCTHFEPHGCEKWKNGCSKCPALRDYPKSYLLDRSLYNYKHKKESFNNIKNLHLVPVSNWLKSYLDKSFLRTKPNTVIKNGIDLNVFSPAKTSKKLFPNKKIILGVASVWDKNKGLYDFHKMQKLLNEDETIVLIGLNPNQIKSLPDGIVGVERTSDLNELIEYYTRADCFMNLTYADSYPTTIMEAVACGTPVITYDTGGCPEMVENSELSITVPKKRFDLALETFRNLVMNHDSSTMANKSRNHALISFDGQMQLNGYFDLYENLLN